MNPSEKKTKTIKKPQTNTKYEDIFFENTLKVFKLCIFHQTFWENVIVIILFSFCRCEVKNIFRVWPARRSHWGRRQIGSRWAEIVCLFTINAIRIEKNGFYNERQKNIALLGLKLLKILCCPKILLCQLQCMYTWDACSNKQDEN